MSKLCNPLFVLCALTAIITIPVADANPVSDEVLKGLGKYQTPLPNAGIRNWHVTQNLGPTGARGWFSGYGGDTHESRRILVKSVEPGSPADGVLLPYDIILGAAVPPDTPSTEWHTAPEVKPFASDSRLALARAITWAETKEAQGKLALLCERDGTIRTLIVQLPVLGAYSPTAPYDCPKTKRVVANAAAFVAAHIPANGDTNLSGALNALLLYATGDDRYLDLVRRTACKMSINHTITDAGHEIWRWGYMNTFLCEYYLATGDKRVLPTIAAFCDVIAKGQCNPGTWGHRGVPDFIPPGYGSMNQSGLVAFLSLILADQCGVPVNREALSRSISFYGSYAGIGGVPYGDHPPTKDATSNGKNGSAAVVFYQLGADPAAQWFARLCCSADLNAFEGGHTGNFFNQIWSPLGASLAGPENYEAFWKRFNSYRDLARRWDGSFITQPFSDVREGDLSSANYVKFGPCWSTGGFALSYLAGNHRLAILGRRDSVFAANASKALRPALTLYDQKNFGACITAASQLLENSDERVRKLAEQLQTAARRNINSLELTLTDMKATLERGDVYKLKYQLQAIESIIAPTDTRLSAFKTAVEDPANAEALDEGKRYHNAIAGMDQIGPKGFKVYGVDSRKRRWLANLAANGKSVYRQLAAVFLDKLPSLPPEPDKALTPEPAKTAKNGSFWKLLPGKTKPPQLWNSLDFDDSTWQKVNLPSKQISGGHLRYLRCAFTGVVPNDVDALFLSAKVNWRMKAYLNGTLIMDLKKRGPQPEINVILKDITRELLQPGINCLAIELYPFKNPEQFTVTIKAHSK